MSQLPTHQGYTLPVFACVAAIAALRYLKGETKVNEVTLNLINPPETATIPIEQGAKLSENQALAITRSDPGENLDLTRNTPIWALVEGQKSDRSQLIIQGGEGIGIQTANNNQPAIYSYARQLLQENLTPYLPLQQTITLTLILPEGRQLATRTANAAFGVLKGLSLLGTTGISQPLSAPEQLMAYQEDLRVKATQFSDLVFCIGENGLNLAQQQGIHPQRIVKTANWLGSMLVTAATYSVKSILLWGYHGKLIKLAGGIFHTHHHLADGRLEILISHCVKVGIPLSTIQTLWQYPTVKAAIERLKQEEKGEDWLKLLYQSLGETIDRRCQSYIYQHSEKQLNVGSGMFDSDRTIVYLSQTGQQLLSDMRC